MQFSGISLISLPQVKNFNFCITGIDIQSNYANFSFFDNLNNSFSFNFSGGFITTNNIISSYSSINSSNIIGYLCNNILNYEINEVNNQQNITFSGLGYLSINAGTGLVYCDVIIDSNPINYSVSFNSLYNAGGLLTGTIVSDTNFQIINSSLLFYNSNKALLSDNYETMVVLSGTNNYQFQDIDDNYFEYENNFYTSLPVSFGNIGGQYSSYRVGINNQNFLSLTDRSANLYYQSASFSGVMSGNKFIYLDTPVDYFLNYSYENISYLGYEQNSNLFINFAPINPTNNAEYTADYITGFTISSGGVYLLKPNVSFSQYFYVTGLQNSLQSFLLSTGCLNSVSVSFSGGSPISGASGILILKPVFLSGIYGVGINNFAIVSGYSGISEGWGYQSAPQFILGTGGGCYSLPDLSGYQTPQFKYATGLGALYGQAYGLTGVPLYGPSGSGYTFTGLEITNIGFGYNSGFIPHILFNRVLGDTFTDSGNATGTFYLKNSGVYNFNNFWDISYNLGTGYISLSGYLGYYSGSVPVYGNGNINISIGLSGLDNTSPISGLLSLILSGSGNPNVITWQDVILQSRTFNLNTGALSPNSYPTLNFYPLPDLLSYLDSDPSYIQYLNSIGYQSPVINF